MNGIHATKLAMRCIKAMIETENWLRKDKFGNGIFWELYNDLERQFQNFLEYVPFLGGNENVYSFKLVNIILSIGGHVDSAFKEMARYKGFGKNVDCQKILKRLEKSEEKKKVGKAPIAIPIELPLRAFEKEYELSKRKIKFKRLPEEEEVTPFEPYNLKTNAPKWWEVYNGLKHDVSSHIKQANLLNTLNALASAFLLNVIHIPSVLWLLDHGVLKTGIIAAKGFETRAVSFAATRKLVQQCLEKRHRFRALVETPLFIYEYNQ